MTSSKASRYQQTSLSTNLALLTCMRVTRLAYGPAPSLAALGLEALKTPPYQTPNQINQD